MKWERMIQIEPKLLDLETEADGAHRDALPWYDFLKLIERDLSELVGFMAQKPALRSTRAYEAVVKHLTSVWAVGFEPVPTLPSADELERLSHATNTPV